MVEVKEMTGVHIHFGTLGLNDVARIAAHTLRIEYWHPREVEVRQIITPGINDGDRAVSH